MLFTFWWNLREKNLVFFLLTEIFHWMVPVKILCCPCILNLHSVCLPEWRSCFVNFNLAHKLVGGLKTRLEQTYFRESLKFYICLCGSFGIFMRWLNDVFVSDIFDRAFRVGCVSTVGRTSFRENVCMRVCVYVCVRLCLCTCVRVCVRTRARVRVCVC